MDWIRIWRKKQRLWQRALFYYGFMLLVVMVCTLLSRNIVGSLLQGYALASDIEVDWRLFELTGIVISALSGIGDGVIRAGFLFYSIIPWLYTFCGIVIATCLFHKTEIQPAVTAAEQTLAAMQGEDYQKVMTYCGDNELGELCASVEKLRRKLEWEKGVSWRRQEEQQKINDAFAHDMRTPLTVISGYTDFLQRHIVRGNLSEEVILEKLAVMRYQEERLYAFSHTMTRLSGLGEWEVCRSDVTLGTLRKKLKEIADGVAEAEEKEICLLWRKEPENEEENLTRLQADGGLICEVFENLLSNGLRFAKKRVSVDLYREEEMLLLLVCDDGEGFSEHALSQGTAAYYTEEKNSRVHFGIGLAISQTLAKKHGGKLSLMNGLEGGAVVVASFFVDRK